jgi:hypothetical protein
MRCCFCSLEIFNLVKGHLEAVISRRTNKIPDPHEYSCAECRHRYLPVHVLLDISESTKDMGVGSDNTVLDRTPSNGVAYYIISMATQTKSKTD